MKIYYFFVTVVFLLLACKNDSKAYQPETATGEMDTISLLTQVETNEPEPKIINETSEEVEKEKNEEPSEESIKENNIDKEVVETPVKQKTGNKSVPKNEEVKMETPIEKVPTQSEVKESEIVKPVSPPQEEAKPLNHQNFDSLLRTYVDANGNVNYGGLKTDLDKLENYLEELENADLSEMTRNEKLAFWINGYNAFTLKKILINYPVNSITDLDGGKPWDAKWIKLDGETLSLNQIENEIIRPKFKEPRIHFAVNCAAKSCPPLLNRAFTSSNLNSMLEKQTKAFINDPEYNDLTPGHIKISKIFEWYGSDFGELIDYINRYSKFKISKNAKVEFLEYDWQLNKS